jgi:hypothetical protein
MIENLFIFKTNIDNGERINGIKEDLNSNPFVRNWYLDQEDKDNVLKVQTDGKIRENEIIEIVNSNGFQCEILTD